VSGCFAVSADRPFCWRLCFEIDVLMTFMMMTTDRRANCSRERNPILRPEQDCSYSRPVGWEEPLPECPGDLLPLSLDGTEASKQIPDPEHSQHTTNHDIVIGSKLLPAIPKTTTTSSPSFLHLRTPVKKQKTTDLTHSSNCQNTIHFLRERIFAMMFFVFRFPFYMSISVPISTKAFPREKAKKEYIRVHEQTTTNRRRPNALCDQNPGRPVPKPRRSLFFPMLEL
jgi:hypothetical protein